MSRDWRRYLSSSVVDAGRAVIEQGQRLQEAQRELPEKRYLEVLSSIGLTPRDARVLGRIGHRLAPIIKEYSTVRFPYRVRTLTALSELSIDDLRLAAETGRIHPSTTEAESRGLSSGYTAPSNNVIRPTDNWSFGTLRWPRIDGWEGHGYIPGDLYANCIWYYARHGDTIVDPMAGSGMILKVWEDRSEWVDGTLSDIKISVSDLLPRGPYSDQISQCDLLSSSPFAQADYVILDPPYCGVADGQYSDLPNDLANMEPVEWLRAMEAISFRIAKLQPEEGRCTVIVPNGRTIGTQERYLFPDEVRQIFRQAGYRLYDVAYASRRTQQKQARSMGVVNNKARKQRVPMADIAEILTFIK